MHKSGSVGNLKPREERRRTVLPARMRNGAGWSDACILNISSRGLLIYSKCALQPGSSVELRRGGQLVFARVVWRNNHRIGLCSEDPIPVEDIISSETAAAAIPAFTAGAIQFDRRKRPRDPDRSRYRSRAIEFLSLVLIGMTLAGTAAVYVQQTLSKPLAAASRALSPPLP